MKKKYLMLVLFSIVVNGQRLELNSTSSSTVFNYEINKTKISIDSIKAGLENLKLSTSKKLNNVRKGYYKLSDIIKSNQSKNKLLNDSLLNKSEELVIKVNINENELVKQSQIQKKNSNSYLNLEKKISERKVVMIISLIIILICFFYFKYYYDRQNKKLKSEYDLKLSEYESKLNKTVVSISATINELKTKNSSLSKSTKSLKKDLEKIKSSI